MEDRISNLKSLYITNEGGPVCTASEGFLLKAHVALAALASEALGKNPGGLQCK